MFDRSTGQLSAQVVWNNIVKKFKETENSDFENVRKQVAAWQLDSNMISPLKSPTLSTRTSRLGKHFYQQKTVASINFSVYS